LKEVSGFRKNFVIGLGHQKCATSWLYRYLCQSGKFAIGFTKEYHIWDAIDIGIMKKHLVTKADAKNDAKSRSRYLMQWQKDYYYDYFCNLLDEKYLAADITPAYSGLNASRLERIKNNFNKRGVGVKAVILLRDPVARIKSAVKFNLGRKNYSEGITQGTTCYDSALKEYYTSQHCVMRTAYQNIIGEAEKVFHKDDCYVGIYEEMFQGDSIKKLSSFLGVGSNVDFAKEKINPTNDFDATFGLSEEIRSFYKDTYAFCFDRYPVTKKLWSQSASPTTLTGVQV